MAASQLAKDFAQFAISEQGQQLVEQTGLISQNIRVEQVFPADGAPASYNDYARWHKSEKSCKPLAITTARPNLSKT